MLRSLNQLFSLVVACCFVVGLSAGAYAQAPQQTKEQANAKSQQAKKAVKNQRTPAEAPAMQPGTKRTAVKPQKDAIFGPGEWGVKQGRPRRVAKANKEEVFGPGEWGVKPGDSSVAKPNKNAVYGPGGWNVRQKQAVQKDQLLKKSAKGTKKSKGKK